MLDRGTKLALLKTARLLTLVSESRRKAEENSDERIQSIRREHLKELRAAENKLIKVVVPFFKRQIESTLEKIKQRGESFEILTTDSIFDRVEWDTELKDVMLPTLAQVISSAMLNELKRDGINLDLMLGSQKASTATEWLQNYPQDDLESSVFQTPEGLISMGFMTEYPSWMKADIRELLEESFSQGYWEEVNKTTFGDIDSIIQEGARDGWSIERIAQKISSELFEKGEYALQRGRVLARTELAHALNGARSRSMDALIEEVGEDVPMKKQWHSVLGSTTRDTHAFLDGTPENSEGRWYLGGVFCRWPGDVMLPARERVNCQCSIIMVFGMQEDRALELIHGYSERIGNKTLRLLTMKKAKNASSSHLSQIP